MDDQPNVSPQPPASAEPVAPTQEPITGPVAPPPAAPTPPKKKKTGLIVGIIAGVVGLLLIVTAVLLYFLWWQNPHRMVTNAVLDVVTIDTATGQGTFTLSSETTGDIAVEYAFTGDGKNSSVDMTIKLDMETMPDTLELKMNAVYAEDGVFYFRATELDKVLDAIVDMMMSQQSSAYTADPQMEQMIRAMVRAQFEPIVTQINDQWIKVDPSEAEDTENEQMTCVLNVFRSLEQSQMKDEVTRAYKDSPFIIIKEEIEERNGGRGFELDVTSDEFKEKAKGFGENLRETDIAKQLEACDEDATDDTTYGDDEDAETDSDVVVRVWVNPRTHKLTAFELESTDADGIKGVIGMDINVGETGDVTVPSDAKDLDEVMRGLQSGGAGGLVPGLGSSRAL